LWPELLLLVALLPVVLALLLVVLVLLPAVELVLLPAVELVALLVALLLAVVLPAVELVLQAKLPRSQNLWRSRPIQSGQTPSRWQTFLQSQKRSVCALKTRCWPLLRLTLGL
jgi:hypothetical protein